MTATTTGLAEVEADELARRAEEGAAQAQAARDELARRAAERAERLADIQREWDAGLVRRHLAIEHELEQLAVTSSGEVDEAIEAGDIGAALSAWITSRSTRAARQLVRDAARTAEANAQTGVPVSDVIVRDYEPDLLSRLQTGASRAAERLAGETAERLIGQRPTEVE